MRPFLLLPALCLASISLSAPQAAAAALERAPAATPSAKATASSAQATALAQASAPAANDLQASQKNIVRVSVTSQSYDFSRPWSKRAPATRRAIGAVLPGGRVLVTAECVANANYIELENPDGNHKEPATIECVDYEANLALLKPDSAAFLATLKVISGQISCSIG